MKKTNALQRRFRVFAGVMTLVLALAIGMFADSFATVSRADSQGKITASSAKIRKSAGTSGEALGSVTKDTVITIKGEVQGTDGYVWYQIEHNGTSGYIRSDLVKLSSDTSTETPATGINTAGVTKVNPISATVQGSASVRIRNQASTSGSIVTTAAEGSALTVNGTINGTDGKVWYLVAYSANGTSVEGFIRSDYVKLSGELVEYQEPVPPSEPANEPDVQEPPVEEKPEVKDAYEVREVNGDWYLIVTDTQSPYSIKELFDAVENNAAAYEKAHKTVQTQKVFLIIFIFAFIAMLALVAALLLKIKDMMDSAYYRQVETETRKKRDELQTRRNGQRVMQMVGEERKPAGAEQGRPARRPEGAEQGRPARRPEGAEQGRPARRPEGAEQGRPVRRPEGAEQGRPARRPEGAEQGQPARRPEGAEQGRPVRRPEGAEQGQPVRRPAGAPGQPARRPEQNRPVRPAGPAQKPQNPPAQDTDTDDDFSFEFLSDFDE